ncbi:CD9 antigen-like [Littorina saxatilis]|uniref:Tetraspanin n=1 Tax=Littorina saxatilis TaxID=31220 RepID=A0AAN9GIV1_9CAEN
MAFGSCFSCFKYSVFLFNFLLWLLGCALLAVGAWLLMDDNAGRYVEQLTSTSPDGGGPPLIISYAQVTDSNLTSTLAYLFIAFGLVIIFVAFIGCCGAVRENQCMLGAFLLCLVVLFAVLLGIGIWALVARNDVDAHTIQLQQLTNRMIKDGVRNYFTDREYSKFMDRFQTRFKCCGAENAGGDYLRRGSVQQPPCEVAYQRRSCLPVYFNYVGNHFEDFMRDRLTVVGSVAIAIALCMALGMVGVLLLCCAVRERRWNTNA